MAGRAALGGNHAPDVAVLGSLTEVDVRFLKPAEVRNKSYIEYELPYTQQEAMTESGVLKGETLVVGVNTDAYKRAAVVPLRWGAPRIIVLDRGLFAALGENLDQEMFPAARLWRYRFDPEVDLVVSFCRPDEEYRKGANQTRDRIVVGLADRLVAPYTRPKGTMATLAARAASLGRPVQMGASLDEN